MPIAHGSGGMNWANVPKVVNATAPPAARHIAANTPPTNFDIVFIVEYPFSVVQSERGYSVANGAPAACMHRVTAML